MGSPLLWHYAKMYKQGRRRNGQNSNFAPTFVRKEQKHVPPTLSDDVITTVETALNKVKSDCYIVNTGPKASKRGQPIHNLAASGQYKTTSVVQCCTKESLVSQVKATANGLVSNKDAFDYTASVPMGRLCASNFKEAYRKSPFQSYRINDDVDMSIVRIGSLSKSNTRFSGETSNLEHGQMKLDKSEKKSYLKNARSRNTILPFANKKQIMSCQILIDTMIKGQTTKEELLNKFKEFDSDEMAKIMIKTVAMTRKAKLLRQTIGEMGIHLSLDDNFKLACNAARMILEAKGVWVLEYQYIPFLKNPEEAINLLGHRKDARVLQCWPKITSKDSMIACPIDSSLLLQRYSNLTEIKGSIFVPLKDQRGNTTGLLILKYDDFPVAPFLQILSKRLAASLSIYMQKETADIETQTDINMDRYEELNADNCIYSLTEKLGSKLQTNCVVPIITENMKRIMEVEACFILFHDEVNNSLWMPLENKEAALRMFKLGDELPEGFQVLEEDTTEGSDVYKLRIDLSSNNIQDFLAVRCFKTGKRIYLENVANESIHNHNCFNCLDKLFGYKTVSAVAVPLISCRGKKKIHGTLVFANNIGIYGRSKSFGYRYLLLADLLAEKLGKVIPWIIHQNFQIRAPLLRYLSQQIQLQNVRCQLRHHENVVSCLKDTRYTTNFGNVVDVNSKLSKYGKKILGVEKCNVWLLESEYGSTIQHCLREQRQFDYAEHMNEKDVTDFKSSTHDGIITNSKWPNIVPFSVQGSNHIVPITTPDNHDNAEANLSIHKLSDVRTVRKPSTPKNTENKRPMMRVTPSVEKAEAKWLISGTKRTLLSSASTPGRVLKDEVIAIGVGKGQIWVPIKGENNHCIGLVEIEIPIPCETLSTFHQAERYQTMHLLRNSMTFARLCYHATEFAATMAQMEQLTKYNENIERSLKENIIKSLRISLNCLGHSTVNTDERVSSNSETSKFTPRLWKQIWLSYVMICKIMLESDQCTLYAFDKSLQQNASDPESEISITRQKLFSVGLQNLTPSIEDVFQYCELAGKSLRFKNIHHFEKSIVHTTTLNVGDVAEAHTLKLAHLLTCPIDHDLTSVQKSASLSTKMSEIEMELSFSSTRYWSTCGGCVLQFFRRIVPNYAFLDTSFRKAYRHLNARNGHPMGPDKYILKNDATDTINEVSNSVRESSSGIKLPSKEGSAVSEFTKLEESVANGFSGVCSLDLKNAHAQSMLYERYREMSDFCRLLLTLHTCRSKTSEEHMDSVAQILQRRLCADRVTFFKKQQNSDFLISVHETRTNLPLASQKNMIDDESNPTRVVVKVGNMNIGRCFVTESPIVKNSSANADPIVESKKRQTYSIWSEICVPVITRKGDTIGAIQICNKLPWLEIDDMPSCKRNDLDMQRESFTPADMLLLSETTWTIGEVLLKYDVEGIAPDSLYEVTIINDNESSTGNGDTMASVTTRLIGLTKAKKMILKRRDRIQKVKQMTTAQRMWLAATKLRDEQNLRRSREMSKLHARNAQGTAWKEQINNPSKTTQAAIEKFMSLRKPNRNKRQ